MGRLAARRNYLVDGVSGAGKSSVYEELIHRGFKAVSTDRAWKAQAGWDREKALGELGRAEPEVLFVCGGNRERDSYLPYFTKVFNLRIDDETLRRRLAERTNNDFGKEPEELELMLQLNRSGDKPTGAIDVDATRPLPQVVDDLLRLADCDRTGSWLPAWSRSASSQAYVISGSARTDFLWSGEVLETLLQYLAEQGIDLTGSSVLTAEHRDRYLARLDPSAFDGGALRRYYEQRTNAPADGVEYALLDGIAFLRDALAPLEEETVAVVTLRKGV